MFHIDSPLFTAAELGTVAGIDRKRVNQMLERELIQPTRMERLTVRNRPLFSVVAIFRARLIKILSDSLAISPSGSMLAGMEAERASQSKAEVSSGLGRLAQTIADQGWMPAVARSVDREQPLPLVAAITRSRDCWQFFLELDASKFPGRFGPEPYAVIAVGEIFASVYRQCKALYHGPPPKQPRKRRRARS
jgi:hypothetical protein